MIENHSGNSEQKFAIPAKLYIQFLRFSNLMIRQFIVSTHLSSGKMC
jgi:hypothetical protein